MVDGTAGRTRHPEWEDGLAPFRLWFERIGVEGRCIISNAQLVQPIQLAQHKCRSEPDSSPLSEIVIDSRGPLPELPSRPIKSSVMLKIVDAYLEAVAHQFFS